MAAEFALAGELVALAVDFAGDAVLVGALVTLGAEGFVGVVGVFPTFAEEVVAFVREGAEAFAEVFKPEAGRVARYKYHFLVIRKGENQAKRE